MDELRYEAREAEKYAKYIKDNLNNIVKTYFDVMGEEINNLYIDELKYRHKDLELMCLNEKYKLIDVKMIAVLDVEEIDE